MVTFVICHNRGDAADNVIRAVVRPRKVDPTEADAIAEFVADATGWKAVTVADDFVHPGQGMVIDPISKVVSVASAAAIDAAYTDKASPELQALVDAWADVARNGALPAEVRTAATRIAAWLKPKTRNQLGA